MLASIEETQKLSKKRQRDAEPVTAKKKARRGGGGAWRAFVHCRSAGVRLTAEATKALAQEYWNLSPVEYEHFRTLGETATELHSQGRQNFPAHSARAQSARGMSKKGQSRRHQTLSSQECAHIMEAIASGECTSLPPKTAQSLSPDKHFKDVASSFAATIAEAAPPKEHRKELQGLLCSNKAEPMLEQRKRLRDLLGAKWVPMPHTCEAVACKFAPDAIVPHTWLGQQGPMRESSTKLSESWQKYHRGIKGDPSSFRDPGLRRRPCLQNHFCQCRGKGLKLKIVHQRLRQWMGKLCEDEHISNLIMHGKAALYWVSVRQDAEAPSGAAAAADESGVIPRDQVEAYCFTHISLLYLRPWRPTLTQLQVVDQASETKLLQAPSQRMPTAEELSTWSHVKVEAHTDNTPVVVSIWRQLDMFHLMHSIEVRLWELSSRRTPAADVSTISVKLVEAPGTVLWKGEAREQEGRRPLDPRAILEDRGCVVSKH